MKTHKTLLVAVLLPVAFATTLSSCTNFKTREQNSAATGALIGAGAGAVLAGSPAKGAAVGAALGAGTGYLYEKSR